MVPICVRSAYPDPPGRVSWHGLKKKKKKEKLKLVILEQSFTTVALLIFWAGRFFVVGTVLWRTFSSIPDLSQLDASNTWPKMPRRQKET